MSIGFLFRLFLVAHRKFLRFDLSDMVGRTPSANPAAEEMKIKTAWGTSFQAVAKARTIPTFVALVAGTQQLRDDYDTYLARSSGLLHPELLFTHPRTASAQRR